MYSVIKLNDVVKLTAGQINNNIPKTIKNNIVKNYENKVLGKINSYIIKIIDVNENNIKNGIINDINGDVVYKINYTAVIFNPLKDAVFDIIITKCDEIGLFGKPSLIFDILKKSKTIIDCVIPKNLIEDYKYVNNSWVKGEIKISVNSEIRIKILSSQIDTGKIIIIGLIE